MKIKKRNLVVVFLYFLIFLLTPLSIHAENSSNLQEVPAEVDEVTKEQLADEDTSKPVEENITDNDKSEQGEGKDNLPSNENTTYEADDIVDKRDDIVDDAESKESEPADEDIIEEQEKPASTPQAASLFLAKPAQARVAYKDAIPLKYNIQIANKGYSIDTLPWGVPGQKNAGKGSSQDFVGEMVQVQSESPNGAYAEISHNGNYLGWIDKRAFTGNVVRGKNDYIVSSGYSIDSLPWGTAGFKKLANTNQYIGHAVKVVMTDRSNNYYLAVINDALAGWIDKKAFSNSTNHQTAMVVKGGFSIDSLPWGTPGFKKVGTTSEYLGEKVTLVADSTNKAYSLAILNGKTLGWVDKKAFTTQITNEKKYLINPGYSIDSRPWGEPGRKTLDSTKKHLNKVVYVLAVSENGAYSFVKDSNGKTMGWIDNKAFPNPADRHPAVITRDGFSIDTRPWGEPGFKNISNTLAHYGDSVTVLANSSNNAYALVATSNGTIGWVDKKALVINPTKQKNYILFPGYTIDNRPWGEKGFKSRGVGHTGSYLNREVYVYAVSANKAYYFVKDASGKPLGWIDYKALGNMNGLKRTIKETGYSIDSRPWGEPGYKKLGRSNDHLNKTVTVLGTSSNGAYSAILLNNKFLGWLDNKAFQILIYLDPGHGGIPRLGGNPGAVYNGVREQDLNLNISLQVRDRLEKLGYQVVMSRENGNNSYHNGWEDDLYARPAHANRLGADILVSVHHNASGIWDSSMNGIETYIYGVNPNHPPLDENKDSHNDPQRLNESRKLANAIHKDLIKNTGARDRGVQSGAFIAVREAKMPAVLLELGFMSNKAELNKLTTTSYQQKLVNGIVTGVHSYFLI